LATSAFPRLAGYAGTGEQVAFRDSMHSTLRILLTVTAVGSAALWAAAEPVATVLLDRSAPAHAQLAPAMAVFALALPGWSLVALLARALYAAGRYRVCAIGQVGGWAVAIGAQVLLATALPDRLRAPALAGGYAIGVSAAAVLLLGACRMHGLLGAEGLLGRHVGAMVLAGAVGGAIGMVIGRPARDTGVLPAVGLGIAASVAAAVVVLFLLSVLTHSRLGITAIRRAVRR
jgi:putative peptidoglycan lipid II flippase